MYAPIKRSFGSPRSKYKNIPTMVDGFRFSSKAEAAHYQDLVIMQRVGLVNWFIRQPRFDIGAGVVYVADFLVHWNKSGDGYTNEHVSVQDVKGALTQAFEIKRKLFEEIYGPLEVIKKKAKSHRS